jgi:hypothetical protein
MKNVSRQMHQEGGRFRPSASKGSKAKKEATFSDTKSTGVEET